MQIPDLPTLHTFTGAIQQLRRYRGQCLTLILELLNFCDSSSTVLFPQPVFAVDSPHSASTLQYDLTHKFQGHAAWRQA